MKSLLFACAGVLALSSVIVAQDDVKDAPAGPEVPDNILHETFDDVPEKPPYSLTKHAEGHLPAVKDGKLQLLSGEGGENNSAAWPVQTAGEYRRVKSEVVFTLTKGARGLSFMLLNTAHFANSGPAFKLYKAKGHPGAPKPAHPEWDEPNLWGSFAVALDTHNPPTDDPFNEWGNVHERPQREISLHWDGVEVANRFCEPDFVTGEASVLAVEVAFVTGGAEVTVGVGGQAIYDSHFIPHMLPFESRAAVGAFGPDGGACAIDSLHAEWDEEAEESPAPVTVHCFKSAWNNRKQKPRAEFDLMPAGFGAERVIMSLKLKPMVERDEWDRLGHVWLYHEGERYELARVLTPFMLWGESYEYLVDVSDFRNMLTGRCELHVDIGVNVGRGYVVDLDFTYYRRPADVDPLPEVVGIVNVWGGTANFNNADSVAKTFGTRTVAVPEGAKSAKLHITVTGHGALEFRPLARTVKIGEVEHTDPLHTKDCYLNPWRPQFGTWKYDRAGWGPGTLGDTWTIDVSTDGLKELKLEYTSEEYKAEGWASHVIRSQVVFYGE